MANNHVLTSTNSLPLRINRSIGAGTIVQIQNSNKENDSVDCYFVTPASHVGRIVTGIVLIGDIISTSMKETTQESNKRSEDFGHENVQFADLLAQQCYKVLLLNLSTYYTKDSSIEFTELIQCAMLYLKEKHGVQRVGIAGNGFGADIVIKMTMEHPESIPCSVALSPNGNIPWNAVNFQTSRPPLLLISGEENSFSSSSMCKELCMIYESNTLETGPALRFRLFSKQSEGFAYNHITDEDSATQAIAEILDWLMLHLHRFRVALGTSDNDPWWPQGRNGPFLNIGRQRWYTTRIAWTSRTHERPPLPPPVPNHLIFDGLSSVRRTFDLPHRMRLGAIVELLVEIWEEQQ